jgi:hypothetical protein
VLIPLKREFDVPTQARLAEDRAFLVDPANPAQAGALLKPRKYHLFRYTSEDLKVNLKAP